MRRLLAQFLVSFSFLLSFPISANEDEIPLTTTADGSQVRWVNASETGIKVPAGTSDTLICDPTLLAIAQSRGLGSGDKCIRLSNTGADVTNYVASTDETFGNFLEKFAERNGKEACDVIPDPWTEWDGTPPQASSDWNDPSLCGVQGFTESRVCTEPQFSCSDTCPGLDSTFTEYRSASVDNGDESIWHPVGLTEVQQAATCYHPATTSYNEINECNQARTRSITCSLIPGDPALSAPTLDTDGIYTLSWGAVDGGATYQVVGEGAGTIYNGPNTSVARAMPTGIYDYKVRACSAGGTCGDFSVVRTVRVDITPETPSVTAPTNNASGSYTVSWPAITGAATYQLVEGNTTIFNGGGVSKSRSGLVTGVYDYKLRACNSLGTCSGYSAITSTRVSRIPNSPVLTAPANDSDGAYTVSWTSVTHATSYQLVEGSTTVHNGSGTSKSFSGKSSAVYSYKIRACNALGDCGAYSAVKTTRVSRIPSVPALTAPANDSDGAYTVSWTSVTHATSYQLVEGSTT
ncbi:hypothetical protein N9L54_06495, partial [Porticoccaceae bacterium]|nr:hypothetical protein [Porticoccaceae bacterium]